jgi:hypothetical protein
MRDSKVEKYLSWCERVIALIKPKFHNVITNTVVIFGLTLAAESQINILEAFAVAFYESIFGSSEYLRNFFAGSSNPWIGLALVVVGLVYHAVVTVGLELIQKYKDALPKQPVFEFAMLNSDMEEFGENYTLRGEICSHSIDKIPNNNSYSESTNRKMEKEGAFNHGIFRPIGLFEPQVNMGFYRERAKFLQIWGGAEIIKLSLKNCGVTLTNNARVELSIKKVDRLSASNANNLVPKLPSQETQSDSALALRLTPQSNNVPFYDIKKDDTNEPYFFEWKVGNLQPQESCISKTSIFLRSELTTDINVKVFCDELAAPIEKTYKIEPTPNHFEFDLSLLMSDDRTFIDTVDDKIMNGYMSRYAEQYLEKSKSRESALLP